MNEKIKAWLARVSPEKIVLAGAGLALLTSLVLMVCGVVTHSSLLRKAAGIAMTIAVVIAFRPLTLLLVMLGIEKLKTMRGNRTSH
jgi:hypothetical protein